MMVDLFVEGWIESIDGNIVVIFGIEHAIEPTNPLLEVIEVGDYIRITGDNLEKIVIATPAINNNLVPNAGTTSGSSSRQSGSGWQDNGRCDNPPPDHAPANGWRARCEGADQPGSKGSNKQSNGNGKASKGRGNNNDDD
jgi:hypothetical protein